MKFEEMELHRSRRRSLSILVKPDGRVVLRAPARMPENEIRRFVETKSDWIERHMAKFESIRSDAALFTEEEKKRMKAEAKVLIEERVRHYSEVMGIGYGCLSFRFQKTRWGSCSSKGNLSFNCLLVLAPMEVLDSVVIHELSHRRFLNHSERFWKLVCQYCPDYDKCRRWLKREGVALMMRL